MKPQKVLVAGAGIGGLAVAAGLLRQGIDVEVYEQAPVLGEIGAGIQFSANAVHVLRHLGIGAAIEAVAVRPLAYEFRLHDSGELVQAFPLAEAHERQHGAPYYHLHRADVHDILADLVQSLKPDAIHTGHEVVSFAEDGAGVSLRFAHGAAARGDMLVGADGIRSVVRERILGPLPARYTGDAAWRITVPADRLPADFQARNITLWMGPGTHGVSYYIRAGALLNFVGILETDRRSEESWVSRHPWEDLAADFAGWNEKIRLLIDAVDRDACFRWSLHDREPVSRWSTGRATLLGDAAHPTLPYLAQGAAMAIEDSAVLVRALEAAPSIPAALDLYQRNRTGRTARIVRESSANRSFFRHRSADAARAAFAGRDVGGERNRWLYAYNPLTVELV